MTRRCHRRSRNLVTLFVCSDDICKLTYISGAIETRLQQGDRRNRTDIDDKPVLQSVEITSGCNIKLGNTRLKFVALCGPEFDWQDQQGEA